MTLREQLLAAVPGLTEADFDRHESDLYVLSKPGVVNWLKSSYPHWSQVTEFVGAAGSSWAGLVALDIPFGAMEEHQAAKINSVVKSRHDAAMGYDVDNETEDDL